MKKGNTEKGEKAKGFYENLEGLVRVKVQEFIQEILDEEVKEFIGRSRYERKEGIDGDKIYYNGYGKTRRVSMKAGTIEIKRPRLRNLETRFESRILPLFTRRTKEVGDMLPDLYLHGLSLGDFELALRGMLGEGAPLSAASIQRLKSKWENEYNEWRTEDLSSLEIVYMWADGLFVKAGLEKDKSALLVIIGVTKEGNKKLLTVESGYRESKESWRGVLRTWA